ncbi:hypothetical protein RTBOTA2_003616 [Rhodotorula toruloides]|nr:hypothetical protein RTBOTA2_003616 [Rhodotorula toruloides]
MKRRTSRCSGLVPHAMPRQMADSRTPPSSRRMSRLVDRAIGRTRVGKRERWRSRAICAHRPLAEGRTCD